MLCFATSTEQLECFSFALDYDECNPENDVHMPACGINATCINTNTSFECVCHVGFVKNGIGCIGKY